MKPTKRNNKNRKRNKNVINTLVAHTEPKFFDTLSLANSIGAGATLIEISEVPQGDTQSSRVGDFIQPLKLIFNYSLYTVNSDIVTTVRIIFFRWIPSNGLVAPVLANILQSPSSSNVLSHFNFQTQDNYRILWDRQYQASGITVAPTVNSNFGGTGIVIAGKLPEIEFTPGTLQGTNNLYLLAISDSALTPFPILNFSTRLYYEDTIKAGAPARMPK
jgi:hypothetical protein